jgi:hypothetical protein
MGTKIRVNVQICRLASIQNYGRVTEGDVQICKCVDVQMECALIGKDRFKRILFTIEKI